jgi:hypothetical protein
MTRPARRPGEVPGHRKKFSDLWLTMETDDT